MPTAQIEQPVTVIINQPPPLSWEGLSALGPILLIAVLGGVVNFIRKVRAKDARPFNIAELVGEIITSGFAGVLAYWLVHTWLGGAYPYVEAFTVGLSGHAGSRAIFLFERWGEKQLDRFNVKE